MSLSWTTRQIRITTGAKLTWTPMTTWWSTSLRKNLPPCDRPLWILLPVCHLLSTSKSRQTENTHKIIFNRNFVIVLLHLSSQTEWVYYKKLHLTYFSCFSWILKCSKVINNLTQSVRFSELVVIVSESDYRHTSYCNILLNLMSDP